MDTFYEQIVVRRKTSAEKIWMISAVVLGAIGVVLLLFFAYISIGSAWSILFTLMAAAFGYSLWWFVNRSYVEYEYSLTNACFDIDRIIGKKKRARLLETKCTDFMELGKYDQTAAEELKQRKFDTVVTACDLKGKGVYYFIIRHSKYGNTLVLIRPNEQITDALKRFARSSAVKPDV